MKKIICIFAVGIVITGILTSCTTPKENDNNTDESESTTEATTAIQTTTEDLDTSFAETETRRIFEGLEKGNPDDFNYKIASYSTKYNTSETGRTKNMQIACDTIDYMVLPKDEIFSFNQLVGKRTLTAGYQTAKVISNNEFVDGLGGGICQVVTTIFEAVLRTNAEIVERSNHSLVISYAPLGGDAAVQWNTQDFKFKNTTGTDLFFSITCKGGTLTVSIYGREKIDVGNISINISQSGGTYTLVRYCNGQRNYTTSSKYKTA